MLLNKGERLVYMNGRYTEVLTTKNCEACKMAWLYSSRVYHKHNRSMLDAATVNWWRYKPRVRRS